MHTMSPSQPWQAARGRRPQGGCRPALHGAGAEVGEPEPTGWLTPPGARARAGLTSGLEKWAGLLLPSLSLELLSVSESDPELLSESLDELLPLLLLPLLLPLLEGAEALQPACWTAPLRRAGPGGEREGKPSERTRDAADGAGGPGRASAHHPPALEGQPSGSDPSG